MPRTLRCPDGVCYTLLRDTDFCDVIKIYAGEEAADIVRELQTKKHYEEQRALSDCDAYEASLESNRSCFQELLHTLDALEKFIFSNQINQKSKAALLKYHQEMVSEIYQQL